MLSHAVPTLSLPHLLRDLCRGLPLVMVVARQVEEQPRVTLKKRWDMREENIKTPGCHEEMVVVVGRDVGGRGV